MQYQFLCTIIIIIFTCTYWIYLLEKVTFLESIFFSAIRVATLEYPLYTILEPLEGMEFKLLKEFCKFYNCSLGTVVDDYMWGEIWENKSGNGKICVIMST